MRSEAKRRTSVGLRAAAAATALTAGLAPLHGQPSPENFRESEAQRQACKPDVFRLCRWYIPSRTAITYCLHQNIDRLSPDCRAVMEGRLR